jgi:hypothetical protein
MTSASNGERRRRKATAGHGTELRPPPRTPKHHHYPSMERGAEAAQEVVERVRGEWLHEVRESDLRASGSVVSLLAAATVMVVRVA